MAYTITVVGGWGDLNKTIENSPETEVIVDASNYNPMGIPYNIVIPNNVNLLTIKGNKSYVYKVTVAAPTRSTPVGLIMENMIIEDNVSNKAIIDIARNLYNNRLILKDTVMVRDNSSNVNVPAVRVADGTRLDIEIFSGTTVKLYSTAGSAIIGGLQGEKGGQIVILGTGNLILARKSTDTGAGIGGGAGAGGGFIHIADRPNVTFIKSGTGTPQGKDIGNGDGGTGTFIISIDPNLVQSINPTVLSEFSFRYGLSCPQISIYTGPIYVVDNATSRIIGYGMNITSQGQIQFYSDVTGTYYFSSSPVVGTSITRTFDVPGYVEGSIFYFPCTTPVSRGMNLFA